MKKVLELVPEYKLVLMLLLLALLLRLPWLYTTIEKDEGQFGYTAWRWLSGERLYLDLKDNKPPLLYMAYALPIFLFGNSIIPVRLMNDILFLISVIFFFKLTKNLFSKKTALFSTLFYALFMNIPVFEGYLAMSESLLTPFLIMSVYFFEKYASSGRGYLILVASFLALVSLFIKQQAIFVFFLLITGLFIYKKKNKIKNAMLILIVPSTAVFITVLLNKLLFLRLLQKTWSSLTQSPWGLASGYIHYEYYIPVIIEGSLLLLFSVAGLVNTLRLRKTEKDKFMILWLAFAAFFSLIPPAYGHYHLLLVPPLSIFAGLGTVYLITTHQNRTAFILLSTVLFLVMSLLIINHFPNSTLNIDFLKLRWGWSNFESYDQQLGIANFIKSSTGPEDKILVIGWEPVLYWLGERRPPHNYLAYYLPETTNMSEFEHVIKKEDIALVIFAQKFEDLDKQLEFLSNPKIVYGVKTYKITLNEDYCYSYIIRKQQDKKICELISTPFLKQICLAVISLDFQKCYDIPDPFFKNLCLTRVAVGNRDPNNCRIMEEYNPSTFNFCISHLKGEFDYGTCVDSLKSEYGEKIAGYFCRRRYAIFMNDTAQCEHIEDSDEKSFCKEGVTLDKSYCETITDRLVYSWCMVDATSNPDYCKQGIL